MTRPARPAAQLLLLAALSTQLACGGSGPSSPPTGGGGGGGGGGAPQEDAIAWGFFAYTSDFAGALTATRVLRATGVFWDEIERPPGTRNYDWNWIDARVMNAQAAAVTNVVVGLKTGHGPSFSDPDCSVAVEAAAAAGVLLDPRLASCPLKAGMEGAWTRMVTELVERYDHDGIDDMPGLAGNVRLDIQVENEAATPQLWHYNEPNRTVAADRYLRLLELSYQAKQAAHPGTQVILAGFTHPNLVARCDGNPSGPECTTFILQTLAFMERVLTRPDIFDAVDVHFFVYYHFDPQFVDDGVRWVVEQMQQRGYQRPIYSLEWTGAMMRRIADEGHIDEFIDYFPYSARFPTPEAIFAMYVALDQPENVVYRQWFEAEQAKEFAKLFTNMLARGVRRLVHVQYSDYHGGSWNNPWWNWQGIIKYVGGAPIRKPGYYTYNILSQRISGFTAARQTGPGGAVHMYEFTFPSGGPTYVLWTEGPGTVVDISPFAAGGSLRVTHLVTTLDAANQPIGQPDQTVPSTAVPVADLPVLLRRVD